MEKTYVTTGGRKTVAIQFRASVPMHLAPAVAKEFTSHGMRMYLTTDGRTFNADIYDANFKVPKSQVVPKSRKGMAGRGRR